MKTPPLALPLVALAAHLVESGAQRLLRPLPKVDPLSDGIFVRSVELPPVEAPDSGGGAVDSDGESKSRRRLIVYDFRPAFPPYTAKSLEEIFLFPGESVGEAGGAEEGEGGERVSKEDGQQKDEQGEEQVVYGQYSDDASGGAERREALQNEIDAYTAEDVSPTDEEIETPFPVEQVDAANEPVSEDLTPKSTAAAATSGEGPEKKSTDDQLSDMDKTPPKIELMTSTNRQGEEKVEKEKSEVELSTVVANNDNEPTLETSIEDERAASGEEEEVEDAEPSTDDVTFRNDGDTQNGDMLDSADAPKGGDRKEGLGSIDSPSEEQAVREETSQNEIDTETKEEPTNPDNMELTHSSQVESERPDKLASVGLEEDHVSDDVPAVSAGNAVGSIDSTHLENKREDEIWSETTTAMAGSDLDPTDDFGKEEGGAGPPSMDNAIVSDGELPDAHTSPGNTTGAGRDSPKEKITVRYDDAVLKVESSTASNNRDANRKFVTGLDEIDKLFESVDVPDELDVGADGSSMQDVLVGQGLKILWKRLRNLGKGVKGGFDDAAEKVRGALLPLTGLLGGDEEEEEEDVTFESLLGKALNGDGAGSVVFDKNDENAKEEGVQPKREDQRSNNSKKEKKGRKTKEKKESSLPLLQPQKVQRIWKFARRKWEQAKLLLDELLHIFEGAEDDDDDVEGNFGLGDMKLPKGLPKGVGTFKGAGEMPNFDGKFGSEVDESFLKSRYEAMLKLQQKKEQEE